LAGDHTTHAGTSVATKHADAQRAITQALALDPRNEEAKKALK
jgi:hypothetical protein